MHYGASICRFNEQDTIKCIGIVLIAAMARNDYKIKKSVTKIAKVDFFHLFSFFLVKCLFFSSFLPRFPALCERDKIVSAKFEWKLIVPLQRQGKDCISMKWAIDLSDESLAPWWACHAQQFLWEPTAVSVSQMIYINYLVILYRPVLLFFSLNWKMRFWCSPQPIPTPGVKKESVVTAHPVGASESKWHM